MYMCITVTLAAFTHVYYSHTCCIYMCNTGCMYTFLCEACAYADLNVEFRGGDHVTWWVTCFFAWPGGCLLSFPCHYLCIHPELRRLIAIKHGKNVI